MNTRTTTLLGTLKPDGTLELSERPSMPAGRVEVTIRLIPEPANGENWLERLERIRARQEASGHPFRTKHEIIAEIEDQRSGWDDKDETLP